MEYQFNNLKQFSDYLEELASERHKQALRARPKEAELLTREIYTLRNVAMMVRKLKLNDVMFLEDTLEGIRAALDTEETGTNLIEVARHAHEAERKLAAQERENAKVVPFKKK